MGDRVRRTSDASPRVRQSPLRGTHSRFSRLHGSFFLRPTLAVARDLLGRYLVRRRGNTRLIGKIVEVEAYLGSFDPASHTYRGKTLRNEVMFRKGGHLYVYFTYGMHFCANVVTEEEGTGHAVLIRAVEPLEGIATMKKLRKLEVSEETDPRITNGPAKLCQAFGIGRRENGTSLLGREIYLTEGEPCPISSVVRTTRIGIRRGVEHPWRLYVRNNPFISKR